MDKTNVFDPERGSRSYFIPPDVIQKESANPILHHLLLTWAGCYIRARGHQVQRRVLPDYVMIYCVEGRGWLQLGQGQWPISKGTVFVCPPGTAHSYGADVQEPWTKYWLHFCGGLAPHYMEQLGFTADQPVQHVGENAKILTGIQDVFHSLEPGYSQSHLLMATAHLQSILAYMHSLIRSQVPQRAVDAAAVIAFMLDNVGGTLTLDEIAAYANVSKYHLVRVFKETTGYTPMDYYIRLKMQRACQLLESSAVTVGSIAAALGFNSPYYFSTTFKRVIGQSPQQYRRMLG